VPGEVPHNPGQEGTVGLCTSDRLWAAPGNLLGSFPVGRVTVLAAKPQGIHPRRMRHMGIEPQSGWNRFVPANTERARPRSSGSSGQGWPGRAGARHSHSFLGRMV